MLTFEKLIVYPHAIRFLQFAIEVLERLPRGYGSLADQLRRASMSIPLNIAEATGKTRQPDKRRYFAMARGSAMECGAIIEVCHPFKVVTPAEYQKQKQAIHAIVSMLSKLSRALPEQEQEQEHG